MTPDKEGFLCRGVMALGAEIANLANPLRQQTEISAREVARRFGDLGNGGISSNAR